MRGQVDVCFACTCAVSEEEAAHAAVAGCAGIRDAVQSAVASAEDPALDRAECCLKARAGHAPQVFDSASLYRAPRPAVLEGCLGWDLLGRIGLVLQRETLCPHSVELVTSAPPVAACVFVHRSDLLVPGPRQQHQALHAAAATVAQLGHAYGLG